jgi:aspartate ammonia-lyase
LPVSFAAEAGQLELNVMEPVIVFGLFNSLIAPRLEDACRPLRPGNYGEPPEMP